MKHRAFISEHAIDPDLWRTAGWVEEPPQHFLDLDAFGAAPFDALPREKDAAIAKFGKEMVQKNGLLPWRVEEMHGKLVRAFADVKAERPYAKDNIKFLSAVLAHYVGDAHVPFHAVVNYDGQLTNQHGLHSRFESQLFERYRSSLRIRPTPMPLEQAAARVHLRHADRQRQPGRPDARRRSRGDRIGRGLRSRVLRTVLRQGPADARASALGSDRRDRRRDHPCLGGRRQTVARRCAAAGPPEAPGGDDAVAAGACASGTTT